MQAKGASTWPALPGAPTIGTATSPTATTASVPFTAPACAGYPAITGYLATSTPGCITGTAASSPITVSGLTTGTAYTFKVKAQNATGYGPCSAASNSVTPAVAPGQDAYTSAGTYSWVAPANVTSIAVVAVGGGGGGGGSIDCEGTTLQVRGGLGAGLGYKNNVSTTPGNSYTVVVGAGGIGNLLSRCRSAGGDSYFCNTSLVKGGGAQPFGVGNFTGDGGGNGGPCAGSTQNKGGPGGGGAGGYSGAGGTGGSSGGNGTSGSGGSGGGGGGGCQRCIGGAGGGGVGLLGQGSNGAGGTAGIGVAATGGGGGSGGANGAIGSIGGSAITGHGGAYGGGGGGGFYSGGSKRAGSGAVGAVRIIWPATTRSFPSTNTGNL